MSSARQLSVDQAFANPPIFSSPLFVAAVRDLCSAGWQTGEIARLFGCTRTTIKKYLDDHVRPECGCGRPISHGGWCQARIARDKRRQAQIASQRRGFGDPSPIRPPLMRTPARKALLSEWWANTDLSSTYILARLNELPGRPFRITQVYNWASDLGLKRPALQKPIAASGAAVVARVTVIAAGRTAARPTISPVPVPVPAPVPPVVTKQKSVPFSMGAMQGDALRSENERLATLRLQALRQNRSDLTTEQGVAGLSAAKVTAPA